MIVKDVSLSSPSQNIILDEVLLKLAEEGVIGETLRFWESPSYFVVLGRIGRENEDVAAANVLRDNISVLRRASGGGTVLQGPGCLNFTFVLSKNRSPQMDDIKKSYHYILDFVLQALNDLGVAAQFFPTSDLALIDGRKFSGNAQKRGKKFILHHGTILYNFDLSKIEKYLLMPKDMPDYREKRGHLDFVTNIPLRADQFKEKLIRRCGGGKIEKQLTAIEEKALQEVSKQSVVVPISLGSR